KGRDRLDAAIAQVDGVEVELQMVEERKPGNNRNGNKDEKRNPVTRGEAIDRRKPTIADGVMLSRRPQQGEERREKGDAGDEGDNHPNPGDQPELRDADVIARQEGEEAYRSGRRSKGQWLGDCPRSRAECALEIAVE